MGSRQFKSKEIDINAKVTSGAGNFQSGRRRSGWLGLGPLVYAPSLFLVMMAVACMTNLASWIVFGVYAVASLVTFWAYFWDKMAAAAGRWRTPEKSLHILSLIGGWPGAMLAQQLIRHKSSKASFQMVFWVTVGINCLVLVWVLTRDPKTISRVFESIMGV